MHLLPCVDVNALAVTDEALDRPSIVGGASIYPFVHNILLGLRHEGLGAAFTTLLVPAEPQIRELLSIPEGIAVAGHISVGLPLRPVASAAQPQAGGGLRLRRPLRRALVVPARRQPTRTPMNPSAVTTTHRNRYTGRGSLCISQSRSTP